MIILVITLSLLCAALYINHLHSTRTLQKKNGDLEREKFLLQKTLEEMRVTVRVQEIELQAGKDLAQKTEVLVEKTRVWLSERFETLSSDAFFKTQSTFFEVAKQTFEQYQTHIAASVEKKQGEVSAVISPLRVSLEQMEKKVQELEVARRGAYEGITQQLTQLSSTQALLQKETGNLAKALREPNVRGRWGEIQLRRVVEVAGMLSYCDFAEQVSIQVEDGALRPDMIIKLPNDRIVVVDAKVSLGAYLDAVQADDPDTKKEKLVQHAKYIRQHVVRLAQKRYWDQFPKAPDFVLLFLHGDCFLAPALEQDTELLEFASAQRVLLATPTSLIAMLKVIAYAWGEAKIEQNAQCILTEARQLLDRCKVFTEHLSDVGRHLERCVKAYDKAASSFESRFLVSLKRLACTGVDTSDLCAPSTLNQVPMVMQNVESD